MKQMNNPGAPHIRHEDSARSMTLDFCIALLPALIWGFYVFGVRSVVITLLSLVFFLGFEALSRLVFKKAFLHFDFSAVGSALLFAMLLPVSVPLWIIPIGAFLAVVVAKGLLGGMGKIFLNPVLFAKAILLLIFPKQLNLFTLPFSPLSPLKISLSKESLAPWLSTSPLAALKEDGFTLTLSDLITGSVAGNIGEISALLLLAGLLYLLVRGVVFWRIPSAFLVGAFFISLLFSGEKNAFSFALNSILSGGILLGGIFLATDPPSSPVTRGGMLLYGFLGGALTILFRSFGENVQGMVFAILAVNLLSRPLDLLLKPRPYGKTSLSAILWKKCKTLFTNLIEKIKPLLEKLQKKN